MHRETVSEPPEQWVSELTYMQGPWLWLKKQTRLVLVCVTAGQSWTDMQTGKLAGAQPLKSTAVSYCPNTPPTFHKIYSTDFLLTDQTQLININIPFVNKCIFIAIQLNTYFFLLLKNAKIQFEHNIMAETYFCSLKIKFSSTAQRQARSPKGTLATCFHELS